jgi:hypothetical protein
MDEPRLNKSTLIVLVQVVHEGCKPPRQNLGEQFSKTVYQANRPNVAMWRPVSCEAGPCKLDSPNKSFNRLSIKCVTTQKFKARDLKLNKSS